MKKRKLDKRGDSIRRSEEEFERLEAAKAHGVEYATDLRRIRISTQDELDIGLLSSGWNAYQVTLREQFVAARSSQCTKANHVADLWNRIGFRTGSGKLWTPRLVNIAKHKLGIKHGSIVTEK